MLKKVKIKVQKIKSELLYNKVNRKNIYFVISTGRKGTNFMETFLSSASDAVFCVHDPHSDLFDISIEKNKREEKRRVGYCQNQKSTCRDFVEIFKRRQNNVCS
jgi:hypothetical protein